MLIINFLTLLGCRTTISSIENDNNLFRFGIKKYISAINSMNKNGSFPLEMTRCWRAIHYQNFAILPLVYIAETASPEKQKP